MDCNLLTNYWGKDLGYEYNEHTKSLVGQPPRKYKTIQEARQIELEKCFSEESIQTKGMNARQAFSVFSTKPGISIMPLPKWCDTDAPVEINVYTDGSWVIPQKKFLACGGAGVLWP